MRKKTIRQAEKQKSQRKLQRQTTIPNSGIGDRTVFNELFSLLRDSIDIRNADDVLLICQQINQACNSFKDDSGQRDEDLPAALSQDHAPRLLRVRRDCAAALGIVAAGLARSVLGGVRAEIEAAASCLGEKPVYRSFSFSSSSASSCARRSNSFRWCYKAA